jgi:8-oxo-dGTP diphosphatase
MEAPHRVACAILVDSRRILIARKKSGLSNEGLWEFPGGKVEAGESDQACLEREFKEEFGLEIESGDFFMESALLSADIVLLAYFARAKGAFGFLHDHDAIAFEYPENLHAYRFSPADLPIAEALRDRARKTERINS